MENDEMTPDVPADTEKLPADPAVEPAESAETTAPITESEGEGDGDPLDVPAEASPAADPFDLPPATADPFSIPPKAADPLGFNPLPTVPASETPTADPVSDPAPAIDPVPPTDKPQDPPPVASEPAPEPPPVEPVAVPPAETPAETPPATSSEPAPTSEPIPSADPAPTGDGTTTREDLLPVPPAPDHEVFPVPERPAKDPEPATNPAPVPDSNDTPPSTDGWTAEGRLLRAGTVLLLGDEAVTLQTDAVVGYQDCANEQKFVGMLLGSVDPEANFEANKVLLEIYYNRSTGGPLDIADQPSSVLDNLSEDAKRLLRVSGEELAAEIERRQANQE